MTPERQGRHDTPVAPHRTVAANRVIIGLGLALALGAIQASAGSGDDLIRQGERTVAGMKQAMQVSQEADHERRVEPPRELARQQAEIESLTARLGELRGERDRLRAELSGLTGRIPDRQPLTPMEQRFSAVGERVPLLKTANGRLLRDAEIVKVTDAGIEVRHGTGTARVRCDQLPADWWTRFGWSVDSKEELLATERQQAARLEQRVAAKMQIAAEREVQRQREEQAARLRVQEAVQRALASADTHRSTSPLQQAPRMIGRPYRNRYPYYSSGYHGRDVVSYRWTLPSRRTYSSPVSRNHVSRCSGLIVPAIAPVR